MELMRVLGVGIVGTLLAVTLGKHNGGYGLLTGLATGCLLLLLLLGQTEDLEISRVTYYEYANSFGTDGTLYYLSALEDGETLELRTWIPEIIPSLAISRREAAEFIEFPPLFIPSGDYDTEDPLKISTISC